MRHRFAASAWFVLLLAETGFVRGSSPREAEAERVAALIERLGSDAFAEREAAGKALVAVGEAALPALRAAARHPDAEVRDRSARVVYSILLTLRTSKVLGLKMALVEGGSFEMGSFRESGRRPDETLHGVKITKPYLLGAYEVTQDEYERVMKVNPSAFAATGANKDKVAGKDTSRFPVEGVTWFDAAEFCNRLSRLDGYEPYYKFADVRRDGRSIVAATVTPSHSNGYRLPTEAEWEFACRATTRTRFSFGYSNTGKEANLRPGPATGYGSAPNWPYPDRTTQVGSYPANPWGLYDLHGNAGEWCGDWYERDYPNSTVADPTGPGDGTHRVVRGGSWMVNELSGRSASRYFLPPGDAKDTTGFRVARTP
jgi:formylglycine-generating enzyme required for sulfatase activity